MKRIRKRIVAPAPAFSTALGLAIIAVAASALAQSPAPPSPRSAAADPAVEAARAAFEALPEADRKATQDSLVWTGDYSGIVDGGFGRQTFAAITSYQRRTRRAPNGILDDRARADLQAGGAAGARGCGLRRCRRPAERRSDRRAGAAA